MAEGAVKFEALEAQAQTLMTVFTKRGYEAVAPEILQPAEIFIDVVGESLRARTYVFTDPDGNELCLRPDITVPTCRLHVERHPSGDSRARYCYNGSAFRFQPGGGDSVHPREFRQAGIETIAAGDRERAEVETVQHTIEALRAAGLTDFKLRIGDLGLFHSLLESIGMPKRWRARLRHNFWRHEAFRAELKRLVSAPSDAVLGLPADLIGAIEPSDAPGSEKLLDDYLVANDIEMLGARTLGEVATSLRSAAKDAKAEPLAPEHAETIEQYIKVRAPARAAAARLRDLMDERGVDISDALEVFQRRLDLLRDAGIEAGKAEFSAEFGRSLEYYTGFVFEIEVPKLELGSPVAGGGRYDGLLQAVGASQSIPAVGASIHTERLLEAVSGGD